MTDNMLKLFIIGGLVAIFIVLFTRFDTNDLQEYRKLDRREYSEHDIPYSIVILDGKRFMLTRLNGYYQLAGPIDDVVAEKE